MTDADVLGLDFAAYRVGKGQFDPVRLDVGPFVGPFGHAIVAEVIG